MQESHQTSYLIRRIGPGDAELVSSHYARLSFESRLRRFLSPKPRLTERELAFLTDVDHVRHVALAAVDEGDGSIVGTARYVEERGGGGVADVAVDVVDDLQNQGIGTALVSRVIDQARENGFATLTATTLWENRPALALLRRLGFHARGSHRGEIEFELTLGRRHAEGESAGPLVRASSRPTAHASAEAWP
jgi:RimJ/RimL family protein N-acetyltransferase